MPTPAPAPNSTTFRLAILAMLLSVWLIGRTAGPDAPEPATVEELVDVRAVPPDDEGESKDDKRDPITPEPVEPRLGGITGFVRFTGAQPAPRLISLESDPYCQAFYAGKPSPRDERFVAGDGDTLQNVLVYISAGLPDKAWPMPSEPVMVRMMGCRYEPRIIAARPGQRIEFHNMDATLHNVHPMPKVNHAFSPVEPKREPDSWVFAQAEVGLLYKCDVHPWMIGYIHVMPHPFLVITGRDGAFHIRDLPPGEYELTVWHEMKAVTAERGTIKVTVEAGQMATTDFTMSVK